METGIRWLSASPALPNSYPIYHIRWPRFFGLRTLDRAPDDVDQRAVLAVVGLLQRAHVARPPGRQQQRDRVAVAQDRKSVV